MMTSAYTDEHDRWLNENVPVFRGDWKAITDTFNERFGMSMSRHSVRCRAAYLFIPTTHRKFTEENDAWLKDHAYMDRKTMTRHYNERFGQSRTVRSIEQRCAKIGAYKLIECTKEYQSMCRWSDDIDAWIVANVRRFRGRHPDMVKELNHVFGTRFTERAVSYRKWMLKALDKGYYPEEDEWLVLHIGTDIQKLTEMFNERFNEHRSAPSIDKHMYRLRKKALPDEREGVCNASDGKRVEVTPLEENDKGEAVL